MSLVIFNTDGSGLWSTATRAVRITDVRLLWISEERDFGELAVYFDTRDWDVDAVGLIYTDDLFIAELNNFLAEQGLPAVYYSEQGMQGLDFVSCDVDADFIAAWTAKFGELAVA